MDRRLVEQAMAGDRGAFDELARASINRLYGLASLILRDPDRASDATQEALVAAWRDLSALRDADRFEAWIHRLLVRACHREARRDRRRRSVEIHELPLDQRPGHDELPSLIDRDQLDRAFRRLGVEERTVIVLHHLEGFPLCGDRRHPGDPGRDREVPAPPWHENDAGGHRRGRPGRAVRSGADRMTMQPDLDRTLATWLEAERPALAPDGLLDEVLGEVAQTTRRARLAGARPVDVDGNRHTAMVGEPRSGARRCGRRCSSRRSSRSSCWQEARALRLRSGSLGPATSHSTRRKGSCSPTATGLTGTSLCPPRARPSLRPGRATGSTSRSGIARSHPGHGTSSSWMSPVQTGGSWPKGSSLRAREAMFNWPSNLSWSPDGKAIAFAADVGVDSSIFVADLASGSARQIVDEKLRAVDPAWAPDGSVIAFQSEASSSLHVVAPDGSDEHQLGWLTARSCGPNGRPTGVRSPSPQTSTATLRSSPCRPTDRS